MPTVNMAPFKRRIITSVADAGEISFDRFTAADIPRVAVLPLCREAADAI